MAAGELGWMSGTREPIVATISLPVVCYIISRDTTCVDFAVACSSGSFSNSQFTGSLNSSLTCLRHVFLFVSLKWAAKVTVKELFTNLDRFGCGSSSVVFLREESVELFVAARRVWKVMLFLQGGKSSICIVRCPSTSLEHRAVFLREESLLLYLLLPLDQFGTSCHFPQGGKTLFIIAQLDI